MQKAISTKDWSQKDDVKEFPTNGFGHIKFTNAYIKQGLNASFLGLECITNASLKLLSQPKLKIAHPCPILSNRYDPWMAWHDSLQVVKQWLTGGTGREHLTCKFGQYNPYDPYDYDPYDPYNPYETMVHDSYNNFVNCIHIYMLMINLSTRTTRECSREKHAIVMPQSAEYSSFSKLELMITLLNGSRDKHAIVMPKSAKPLRENHDKQFCRTAYDPWMARDAIVMELCPKAQWIF